MRWAIAALGMAMLTACQPERFEVGNAWVRLNAVPGRPAAGYLTMQGGNGRTYALLSASSPKAGRAELHDKGMRPLASVAVEPGDDVEFAPGGRHIMLYDVAADVKPGDTIPLDLTFDDLKLTLDAKVAGAADPVPTFEP